MANRIFELVLPSTSAGSPMRSLRIDSAADLYIPKVLEQSGLATYEPETLACVLALIESTQTGCFFDVGANVGVFSFLIAACSEWQVAAFEPTPKIADLLRNIAKANELEIDVEEIALGATSGSAELFLSTTTDSSNSLREGFRNASGTIKVPVRTLDDYCAEKGMWPSVLKIDTESTEPDVIRGASKLIAEHRPWIICEVLAKRTEQDLADLLSPYGYHWFQITDEIPLYLRKEIFGDRSYTFNNWLFAPEKPTEAMWNRMSAWRIGLRACVPGAGQTRKPVELPIFPLINSKQHLSDSWEPRGDTSLCQFEVQDNELVAAIEMEGSEKCYLCSGAAPLGHPAPLAQQWPVGGGQAFEIELPMRIIAGEPTVQLWAIQYGEAGRLCHENIRVRGNADSKLRIRTEPSASSVRLAIRLAGVGKVALGNPNIVKVGLA